MRDGGVHLLGALVGTRSGTRDRSPASVLDLLPVQFELPIEAEPSSRWPGDDPGGRHPTSVPG
jgi:hypothetical protein